MIFSVSDILSSTRRFSIALLLPLLLAQSGCVVSTTGNDGVHSPFKTGASEAGEFVWHDLLTGEPEIAKKFYGSLLGWGFENAGRATLIKIDQRVIGSIMEMPPAETRHATRWVASLGVTDISKAIEWTQEQGGNVHEGPLYMKNRGQVALVRDPLGAQLGLIELGSKKISTEPSVVAMGDWLWDELWTQDTDKALGFYSGLYGFAPAEITPGYWVLKSGEHWRGGIRELFDPDLEQRWVPVVRVEDVQAVSARAQELGGRLILAAEQGDADDKSALLADPGGALFIVQEWSGKEELGGVQNEG